MIAHRYAQEDKFKNITLRLEPALNSSPLTTSPDQRQRPLSHSTLSIHIRPAALQEGNFIDREHEGVQSKGLQHVRDTIIKEKDAIIEEKEQIIHELRNIIKLSNENNSRVKPRSVSRGEKSPEQQEDSLVKELRHTVKVLTVQNNALSGYIDKLKEEGKSIDHFQLREQNARLRRMLEEIEAAYERKIDEFIASHKSLASECKRQEELRHNAESENDRLATIIRDLEETRRTNMREEDRLSKTMGDRFSILKIKEQYAESLRQAQETVRIQVEQLTEDMGTALEETERRISILNRRICAAEQLIQRVYPKPVKPEIYIDEGSEASARKQQEDLEGEVGRLKEIIADLQNRLTSRSYTFREEFQQQERERQLLQEVASLREEIDHLESIYREQKAAIIQVQIGKQERIKQYEQKITLLTSSISEYQHKYQSSLQSIQSLKGTHHQLTDELRMARDKVEQYSSLLKMMHKEAAESNLHFQLFSSMKQQIAQIKEKYHQQQLKWAATHAQNKQILAANHELKAQLQHSLISGRKIVQDNHKLQQCNLQAKIQQEQILARLASTQKTVLMLEEELRKKRQAVEKLTSEKDALQKQLIGYLSLFNKLQTRPSKPDTQDLPMEEILSQLSQIEESYRQIYSSRQQQKEMLLRMGMQQEELSSIRREP